MIDRSDDENREVNVFKQDEQPIWNSTNPIQVNQYNYKSVNVMNRKFKILIVF